MIGDAPSSRDSLPRDFASRTLTTEQIAQSERRLAALTQQIATAEAERAAIAAALVLARRAAAESTFGLPAVDVQSAVRAAVWEAFANGAGIVRIGGGKGTGATTLLRGLAAGGGEHGFADGAVIITDVRGPATDIGQRLAAHFFAPGAACFSALELQRAFSGFRRSSYSIARRSTPKIKPTCAPYFKPALCHR